MITPSPSRTLVLSSVTVSFGTSSSRIVSGTNAPEKPSADADTLTTRVPSTTALSIGLTVKIVETLPAGIVTDSGRLTLAVSVLQSVTVNASSTGPLRRTVKRTPPEAFSFTDCDAAVR